MVSTEIELIEGKKLPRLMCLLLKPKDTKPFISKEKYRTLQTGKPISIEIDGAKRLIDNGFCSYVLAEKKGAVKDGTDSTD